MAKRTGQRTGPGDPPPEPQRPAPARPAEAARPVEARPAEVAPAAPSTVTPAPPASATIGAEDIVPATSSAPKAAPSASAEPPAPTPDSRAPAPPVPPRHPAAASAARAHAASHPAHDPHLQDAHGDGEHHVVPLRTYYLNFGALMVLLIITLGAAAVNLGPWNLPIAMAIAVAKAGLIMLFFMHLQWSSKLVRLFAWGALMWLVIMFLLTLSDYFSAGAWRFGM